MPTVNVSAICAGWASQMKRVLPVDERERERLLADRRDVGRHVDSAGPEEMEVVLVGLVVDREREGPGIEMVVTRPAPSSSEDREAGTDDAVQLVARRAGDAGEDESATQETDKKAAQVI